MNNFAKPTLSFFSTGPKAGILRARCHADGEHLDALPEVGPSISPMGLAKSDRPGAAARGLRARGAGGRLGFLASRR